MDDLQLDSRFTAVVLSATRKAVINGGVVDEEEETLARNNAQLWWCKVAKHYSERQRHYHNLDHITAMFNSMDVNFVHINNPDLVGLAIFFHDIIYDPKANDNELQSIEKLKEFAAEVGVPKVLLESAIAFIEATIKHTIPPSITNEIELSDLRHFLDFDLEVLGRDPEEYNKYAKQIRTEYIHVPASDYCKARADVLRRFLDRPHLYFSPVYRGAGFEEKARDNIRAEIEKLDNGEVHSPSILDRALDAVL
ncbi:hypothetical protein HDV00_006119 [Rhizophlyctis rosea]|nr:hypothetical protein HDV00_006119 [Rhizophlyctis rosea]